MKFRRQVGWTFGLAVGTFALVGIFQNCSPIGFRAPSGLASSGASVSGESGENVPLPPAEPAPGSPVSPGGPEEFGQIPGEPIVENGRVIEEGRIDNRPIYDVSDILFVLDESVTMNAITDKVVAGFDSIPKAIYPKQTKMAVTNMHPAYVGADGKYDHARSYRSTISGLASQPGFQKLVSSASIANYLSKVPTDKSLFPIAGCNKAWFEPHETDTQGQRCLKGASQLALKPIGEEAGVLSLMQLTTRKTAQSQRLFRDNALVNVVFVSDTHDAGNDYYGKVGAAAKRPTLKELKDSIFANSPGIIGVKFHGIVPLPLEGDMRLNGLDVIGALPAVSKVTDEELWGFSYLPYIKQTKGKVLHPSESDWGSAIGQMVESAGRSPDLVILLSRAAISVSKVFVEGVEMAPDSYKLSADKKKVIVTNGGKWDVEVLVRVEYEAL